MEMFGIWIGDVPVQLKKIVFSMTSPWLFLDFTRPSLRSNFAFITIGEMVGKGER